MISLITPKWKKSYKTLPSNIKIIAKKQYKFFKVDPHYASLHFKRIHSSKAIYSARINKDYRTLGLIKDSSIIWFWIGKHDEYDKLVKSF
ncbi:hypothetical protein JHD50_01840 [Sulfurimonas sp. MAG313]|nr:hypothetical protein [Sulfurimonas sp. MAG313]MDF1880051.1 hypothetical protein [Sulfurimonas sp. MAG313]